MPTPDSKHADWSRTPAAMIAAAILGIAAIFGLVWSMTTTAKPPETHAQQVLESEQPAPASLLIDLNTADSDQLQLLPSIGPKLAQRIIDDRAENGDYETLKDIDRVKGIGPKTIARLADWVTISSP